jgi:hypothetical protein
VFNCLADLKRLSAIKNNFFWFSVPKVHRGGISVHQIGSTGTVWSHDFTGWLLNFYDAASNSGKLHVFCLNGQS